MAEISNTTLAVLVLTALVVVVAGTVINLNASQPFGRDLFTGFANFDTGIVNLTVNSTLAIQTDSANNRINFATCNPRPLVSYWCASNDSAICDNNGIGNCTGDTASPQYIRVNNTGNVDANVTVTSSCTAAQLIGGTTPLLQYITTNCNGTNVTTWTTFSGATACQNVSYLGGKMQLYVNVTIPNNAAPTGCSGNQSTITFTATAAGQ